MRYGNQAGLPADTQEPRKQAALSTPEPTTSIPERGIGRLVKLADLEKPTAAAILAAASRGCGGPVRSPIDPDEYIRRALEGLTEASLDPVQIGMWKVYDSLKEIGSLGTWNGHSGENAKVLAWALLHRWIPEGHFNEGWREYALSGRLADHTHGRLYI